jgi:hypothetical protein
VIEPTNCTETTGLKRKVMIRGAGDRVQLETDFARCLLGPAADLAALFFGATIISFSKHRKHHKREACAMFSSIRKAKILIPFFSQRLGDYTELARLDLITLRNETIAAIVGAAVGVAAVLLLVAFICIALIVTEWDTPNRVRTAWIVVIGWGLLTGICGYLARFLMKGSSPFANIGSEIGLDLAVVKNQTPAPHE